MRSHDIVIHHFRAFDPNYLTRHGHRRQVVMPTRPDPVPQCRSFDPVDQDTVHSQHLADTDGAFIGHETPDLKTLLRDNGWYMCAIDDS